jgi:hypothetical protein
MPEPGSGPTRAPAGDRREPVRDGRSHGGTASQRMRARDRDDCAVRTLRRSPKWVTLALDDEGRDFDRIELGEAAFFRPARRVERKREAQDGDRASLGGRSTRDPRAQRSTASQHGEAAEWAFA